MRESPPDGVVLIDYMGANVNLGVKVKRRLPGTPILYYIAPQEWAFRVGEGGTTRLIGFTDRILAIFPEEARFYGSRGADVTWVGHPLIDTLSRQPSRDEARAALGLQPGQRLLLLFPASRQQELRYLLPTLAQAAAELQRRCPGLQVMVPAGQASFEPVLRDLLEQAGVQARVIPAAEADGLRPVLCAAADLALNKSGTVNLELALRGVPQVVAYRVSPHGLGGQDDPALPRRPHLTGESRGGRAPGAGVAAGRAHPGFRGGGGLAPAGGPRCAPAGERRLPPPA